MSEEDGLQADPAERSTTTVDSIKNCVVKRNFLSVYYIKGWVEGRGYTFISVEVIVNMVEKSVADS